LEVKSKTNIVDGKRILKGYGKEIAAHNNMVRAELLNTVRVNQKPLPIRRTYIKKPNGKRRPLGIPTLRDRVIQDIARTALEPITEYYFSDNSYGFRPKRSCHDAIDGLFKKLAQRNCRQWVIEGDIQGCFDNISHEKNTTRVENTREHKESGRANVVLILQKKSRGS